MGSCLAREYGLCVTTVGGADRILGFTSHKGGASMWNRSMVSGGTLIILGVALVFGGCSKKVQPVVSDTSAQDMSAKMREDEEAARRAREAAIAERERRMQEESMRRRMSEQQMAMTRDEFTNQDVHFDFD